MALRETRGDQIPDPEEWLQRFCFPYSYEGFVNEVKRVNNFGLKEIKAPPSFVSTCCILANREIIDRVGGLADSRFFRYGCEDVDLSWRISKSGYKAMITSEAYVHHYKHVSVDTSNLDRKALTEGNMRVFYQKWRNEIDQFLNREFAECEDIGERIVESNSNYWFMARLKDVVGHDVFWQSIEGRSVGKERK